MSNITQEDIDALHQSPRSATDTDVMDLCEKIAELQAEVTELRHAAGVANQTIAALQSWQESVLEGEDRPKEPLIFKAPGPWVTRELRDCVQYFHYRELEFYAEHLAAKLVEAK